MKTFLALYMGSPRSDLRPQDLGQDTISRGMKAWQEWMARNADRIVDNGGPLGKTKKASAEGVSGIRNLVAGYVVVRAETHEEAAKLFEDHPHFAIFPGDSVEVMEQLPIPGS